MLALRVESMSSALEGRESEETRVPTGQSRGEYELDWSLSGNNSEAEVSSKDRMGSLVMFEFWR